mgnify:CR=1 FL=1
MFFTTDQNEVIVISDGPMPFDKKIRKGYLVDAGDKDGVPWMIFSGYGGKEIIGRNYYDHSGRVYDSTEFKNGERQYKMIE